MDIVHHALIGGVGYTVLASTNHELAGVAFLAGSVLPDADVAFMAFGKRFYLKNHQGPTHSLLLSPLYALLAIVPLFFLTGFEWLPFLAVLAGFFIHYALDLTNTFGISLFWPIDPKRISFDAVFFIDFLTWTITVCFFIATYIFRLNIMNTFYVYLLIVIAYLLIKFFLHKKVVNDLHCSYAIPSSINPVEYFILDDSGDPIKTYLYNVVTGKKKSEQTYDRPDMKYIDMANRSMTFNDMKIITKALHITNVSDDDNGTTIISQDLAVRNFGGKFGKTTLRFDREGKLIHEMANI
ncbi:MAG: metal-dependent hydrolase [Thermodesulfovibrionales bacterium]